MALPRIPALSVGTDICQISRILTILASMSGPKFVRRILTEDEMNLERGKSILSAISGLRHTLKNPLKYRPELDRGSRSSIKALEKAAQYMAGRWAAKEAVMKAYTVRRITFLDIEIKYEQDILAEMRAEGLPNNFSQEEHSDLEERRNILSDEPETSLLLGNKPMNPNWGPPIAIIRGGGIYEDEYARISISHDGDYAMASCVVNMTEPKLLKSEESDKSQTEVD